MSINWYLLQVNLQPLPWMHLEGRRWQESQWLRVSCAGFVRLPIDLNEIGDRVIIVKALKKRFSLRPEISTSHGPIESMYNTIQHQCRNNKTQAVNWNAKTASISKSAKSLLLISSIIYLALQKRERKHKCPESAPLARFHRFYKEWEAIPRGM